jgi:hypothetical protein
MRKSNLLFSWAENFPHARQKVTRGIYFFFIERVMRLAWPDWRERWSMKTTNPPAATKSAPPIAIALLLPRPESSGDKAGALVCAAKFVSAVAIISGAETALVSGTGFVGATGNGELVISNFGAGGAGGGLVSGFVLIMMMDCMTTRFGGG